MLSESDLGQSDMKRRNWMSAETARQKARARSLAEIFFGGGGAKKKTRPQRTADKSSGGGMRADVISALRNLGYSGKEATARAKVARGSDFDSVLKSALQVGRKNPMATKKRKKKKSRKGKMPAGLRKYWAQKRAKKAKRRKKANPRPRRRRKNSARSRRRYVFNINPRKRRKTSRRRKPRESVNRTIHLPAGLSRTQEKAFISAIRRSTREKVVVR